MSGSTACWTGQLHFTGQLPRAGQTLRFDIHIRRHVRQGDAMIFFFDYEGYVDGKLALVLRDGCAGFFSPEELAGGGGVAEAALATPPEAMVKPLLRHAKERLGRAALEALVRGDAAAAFGEGYGHAGSAVRLPPEQLLMVDRITDLGSRRADGSWRMTGEKDLQADAWYFTSHFVDDPVMPGSLVAEGATQMLKVHLISLGMHQCLADPEFQPIPDLVMGIKVRGQIVPDMDRLRYEVTIVETGFLPRPFVRAHVVVYHQDKPLVLVQKSGPVPEREARQRSVSALWRGWLFQRPAQCPG